MQPRIVDRPGGTGDFLFMFFYDRCRIGTDDRAPWFGPNHLMLWGRGRPHFYGSTERAWRHSWIHCDGARVRTALRTARLPCDVPLPLSDPALAEKHLLAIHHELTEHHRPDERIVANLLENWLLEVVRTLDRGDRPAAPEAMLRVKRRIEAEYTQPLRLNDLAAQVGLTPPYFCALFKRHFGVPPMDYVIQLRMHQAAHLLRDQNMRVTDAAQRVGYRSLFHFSKLFSKRFGVSPSRLRRESL